MFENDRFSAAASVLIRSVVSSSNRTEVGVCSGSELSMPENVVITATKVKGRMNTICYAMKNPKGDPWDRTTDPALMRRRKLTEGQ